MQNQSLCRVGKAAASLAILLLASTLFSVAEGDSNSKILGGYFEEWSIYYAGYNIANLQQNGVADKLTHLMYAFANVTTTPSPACAIADSGPTIRLLTCPV